MCSHSLSSLLSVASLFRISSFDLAREPTPLRRAFLNYYYQLQCIHVSSKMTAWKILQTNNLIILTSSFISFIHMGTSFRTRIKFSIFSMFNFIAYFLNVNVDTLILRKNISYYNTFHQNITVNCIFLALKV